MIKCIKVSLISFLLPGIIFHTVYAKDSENKDSNSDKDFEPTYTENDKKFEKAKDDLAYDPVTKKWTKVKSFKGVEVKDTKSKDDKDADLYDGSWVYDEKNNKWQQVDIKTDMYNDLDEEESKAFGQNLAIGMSLGAGGTYYHNRLYNLAILKHKDDLYFNSEAQRIKLTATRVGWFYDEYIPIRHFDDKETQLLSTPGNANYFTGSGLSFPINLFIDYTFFDRLRIGLGFAIEASFLRQLQPSDSISDKVGIIKNISNKKTFIWNMRPLLNLGYKIYTDSAYDWLINMQIGPVFDKGIGKKRKNGQGYENVLFSGYKRLGLFSSIGLAWELKLNGYWTMSTQLTYDFKHYKDRLNANKIPIFGTSNAYVSLWQHSLKIEVGMRLTFAENSIDDGEDEDDNDQPLSKASKNYDSANNTKDKIENVVDRF
jgi:hypothetical protein